MLGHFPQHCATQRLIACPVTHICRKSKNSERAPILFLHLLIVSSDLMSVTATMVTSQGPNSCYFRRFSGTRESWKFCVRPPSSPLVFIDRRTSHNLSASDS